MEIGSLSSWVGLGLSVCTILAGQVVLWVKFKARVDGKFEQHDEHLNQHDRCISNLKDDGKRYLTMEQLDKIQGGCRAELLSRISTHDSDIDDIRDNSKKMREDIAEIKSMTQQLLVLQTGKIQQ